MPPFYAPLPKSEDPPTAFKSKSSEEQPTNVFESAGLHNGRCLPLPMDPLPQIAHHRLNALWPPSLCAFPCQTAQNKRTTVPSPSHTLFMFCTAPPPPLCVSCFRALRVQQHPTKQLARDNIAGGQGVPDHQVLQISGVEHFNGCCPWSCFWTVLVVVPSGTRAEGLSTLEPERGAVIWPRGGCAGCLASRVGGGGRSHEG